MRVFMLQAKGFSTPGSTKKIEILRSEAGFVFFFITMVIQTCIFPCHCNDEGLVHWH